MVIPRVGQPLRRHRVFETRILLLYASHGYTIPKSACFITEKKLRTCFLRKKAVGKSAAALLSDPAKTRLPQMPILQLQSYSIKENASFHGKKVANYVLQKKNGVPQLTPGNITPSVLNDTPYKRAISQSGSNGGALSHLNDTLYQDT